MNAPLLQVCGLTVDIHAEAGLLRPVKDISFHLSAGETLALLGESGCGKSMTALGLMRLLPEGGRLAAGSVRLGDDDLLSLTEADMREVRGGRMAMVFQDPATSLNPVLSVRRQIVETLERHTALRGDAARARALELLRAVGIPDPEARLETFPFQLSGGMKQRVMIAVALAADPALLIADEPTTALDVTIQAQVLDLLDRLRAERGMGILLITHDLGVVARMASRVGVMYAAELVEQAPRDALLAKPRHPYTVALLAALPEAARRGQPLATIPGGVPALGVDAGGCRFAERCAFAFDRCRQDVPPWAEVGAGHAVRCHLYVPAATVDVAAKRKPAEAGAGGVDAEAPPQETVLTVTDLRVHFPIRRGLLQRTVGYVRAVDGVNLSLQRGRTLALVGESGCGKTTVGRGILQLVRPTTGQVLYGGQDLVRLSAARLRPLRKTLQVVFQDPYASLNPRMQVGEIIAEGMLATGVCRDATQRSERVRSLLAQVGLAPDMAQRYPHEFSGGQRQRIAIARALAVGPEVLVCDEPTSALDVSVQAQILNLLRELQDRLGLAYLVITHNMAVVGYLAHEVAVMYLGRIVEQGPVDAVLGTPRHPYTQALLAAVPRVEGDAGERIPALPGDLPSPSNPPTGCHFHPRCPQAREQCLQRYPDPVDRAVGHRVSCHFPA